ncbi:MAG TPA: response regulator transcription factor [Acidimicrobiia bacterium]|nr:response regulator transcription factor [Acidimicrobiia bacterium]
MIPSVSSTGGTILVVDDEANIADLVELYLRKEGFRVLKAGTGEDGLAAAKRERPRLVVLDVGLPGIDGLEVCRRLRADSSLVGGNVPVIFLTARDGEIDRILGLEMGADDYLTKPFSPRELVARVKAILRRSESSGPAPEVIEIGGAVIDLGRREVRAHLGGRGAPGEAVVVELTGKEFELLRYLAENGGRALSRQQILDGVWGYGWYGDARTVDVHVAQVRKKLGDAVAITTVRGVGYRLDPR